MSTVNIQSVLAPPEFPLAGRLPASKQAFMHNLRQQRREEKEHHNKLMIQAGRRLFSPCCNSLYISLFFDGTNNNEKASMAASPPNPSNIARLYHATISGVVAESQGYYSYYIPGVGTAFPEIGEMDFSASGLKYATGGEDRIHWGLLRIVDALRHTLTRDRLDDDEASALVKKVSTGWGGHANVLRHATFKELLAPLRRRVAGHRPKLLKIKLFVYGFSRGAAEARAFVNALTDILDSALLGQKGDGPSILGLPVCVEYLGLCDTVASVGIAHVAAQADGHMGWADEAMKLPDETAYPGLIGRCYHFVSAHEQRLCFPLDSVRKTSGRYPAFAREIVYPGVHSDVGGGYTPGEQGKALKDSELLSQVVLHDLYATAFALGAPLRVPEEVLPDDMATKVIVANSRAMSDQVRSEFYISETLIDRFNAWRTTLNLPPDTDTSVEQEWNPVDLEASLEQVVEQQTHWITAWRIGRFVNNSYLKQPFFKAAEQNSKDEDPEVYRQSEAVRNKKQKERERARISDPLVPGVPIFEPAKDQQQMREAATEFREDYLKGPWTNVTGRTQTGGVMSILLETAVGPVMYVLNSDDEMAEFSEIKQNSEPLLALLFSDKQGAVSRDERWAQVCTLYDDHIHDSRAWFMHSSLGSRELWGGFFRYRMIYSGNHASKTRSLQEILHEGGKRSVIAHAESLYREVESSRKAIAAGKETVSFMSGLGVQRLQSEQAAIKEIGSVLKQAANRVGEAMTEAANTIAQAHMMSAEAQLAAASEGGKAVAGAFSAIADVHRIRAEAYRAAVAKMANKMPVILDTYAGKLRSLKSMPPGLAGETLRHSESADKTVVIKALTPPTHDLALLHRQTQDVILHRNLELKAAMLSEWYSSGVD